MSIHCASCNALGKGYSHVPILLERLDPDFESANPVYACASCGQEWERAERVWRPMPMQRLPLAA